MSAGFARRALVTVPGFLLAILLISIGTKLAPLGSWDSDLCHRPGSDLAGGIGEGDPAYRRSGAPQGRRSQRTCGIGAVLRSESGEVIGEIARSIGAATNTVADYTALIEGLQMALDRGVTELNVYIDSPLVAGHLLQGHRVRADHLRPLVEHVRQLLEGFSTWSLTRVPRKLNLESDQLANRGIDEAISEVHVPELVLVQDS